MASPRMVMEVALGRCSANSKIIEAMKGLIGDKNQNTRGLVAWVLGMQKCPDGEAALEAMLKIEKTPEVTEMLKQALKYTQGKKVDGYDTMYGTFFFDYDY